MQSRGVRMSVCPSVCKLFCTNRFFYHRSGWIATKLAHNGPHMGLHPGCAQGQGQRSRDTDTFLITRKMLLPQTWLDRDQTCTRWSPHGPASRVCSRSRSKVTWYGHFSDYTKIAFSTTNRTQSPPNLHTMVPTGLHPGCAQGQGQRSRDTGTSVMSRNVCYTVHSDVLSLHTLTLRSTVTLSFQYKCQTARYNV